MGKISIFIVTLTLLSLGLFSYNSKSSANTLKGQVVLMEGQETQAHQIKLSVFHFDSGKDAFLYPVDHNFKFSIPLLSDGEYSIQGLVENDEGFSTQSVRIIVKDGKIVNNNLLKLEFILTETD